jgi:hypothetical protein
MLVLTAGAGLLLAGGAFLASASIEAFDPCRVPYRLPPAVEGSLACQSYFALVLFSKVLSLAACGLAVLAGILVFVRLRTRS